MMQVFSPERQKLSLELKSQVAISAICSAADLSKLPEKFVNLTLIVKKNASPHEVGRK